MRNSAKIFNGVTALGVGVMYLFLAQTASADIYKWVDEQGQVHYGDVPKGRAELMQRSGPSFQSKDESAPGTGNDKTQPQAPSKETPFAMGKSEATAEERCKEFRARVARYKNAGDMFIDQPDGTRHKLADEERQKLIDRTQMQADKACSE